MIHAFKNIIRDLLNIHIFIEYLLMSSFFTAGKTVKGCSYFYYAEKVMKLIIGR